MAYRYPVDFTEPDHTNPVYHSGNMGVKIFSIDGKKSMLKTKVFVGIKKCSNPVSEFDEEQMP